MKNLVAFFEIPALVILSLTKAKCTPDQGKK